MNAGVGMRLGAGPYVGRFAPSPTGPLHAGSLVAALASWLDARARGGVWLVRIEDIDIPRCVPGADVLILAQLSACGLRPDRPVLYQSQRSAAYQRALDQLIAQADAYPCACTRQDIARFHAEHGHARTRHGELVYPGTCRPERGGLNGQPARAWRLRVPEGTTSHIDWHDRALGPQQQQLDEAVGDFILKRADGLWAYQLAVVIDDAAQGVSDVVRGADLADNTPRQIWLQRCLGLPTPRYLHTPLVLGANGEKLSKQNGAQALDVSDPAAALRAAGRALGLSAADATPAAGLPDLLAAFVSVWRERWGQA